MSLENAKLARQELHEYGDAADERRRKNPVRRFTAPVTIPPGLAISSSLYMSSGLDRPSMIVGGGMVLSGMTLASVYATRKVSAEKQIIREFHELNREARGNESTLPVDVIESETTDAALLYHEHPVPVQIPEGEEAKEPEYRTVFNPSQMKRTANHAQDIGIDKIVFEITDDIRQKVASKQSMSLDEWFTKHKSKPFEVNGIYDKGEWVELSAVELHKLAAEVQRENVMPMIEKYVDILRERGHSNIPDMFDRYKAGNVEDTLFKKYVDYEFATEGQDTLQYRELDRLTGEHRFGKEGTYLMRQGDMVHEIATAYDGSSTRLQPRTLLAIAGARDREHLAQLLDEHDYVSDEVEQRARIAILMQLEDDSLLAEEQRSDGYESLYDAMERKNEFRFQDKKTFTRRMLGSMACVGVLAFGVQLVSPRLYDYEEKIAESMEQLYQAQSPQYREGTSYEEFLTKQTSSEAAIIRISQIRKDTVDGVADFIDPKRIGLTDPHEAGGESVVDGGIGDVRRGREDNTLLSVKGINGATTGGYWGQYVADSMSFPVNSEKPTTSLDDVGLTVENTGLTEGEVSHDRLPSVDMPMDASSYIEKGVPIIEVTQPDVIFQRWGAGGLPLTIKEGTEPVAASYHIIRPDGSTKITPVKLTVSADNEWYLPQPDLEALFKEGSGERGSVGFKYWLAETATDGLRANRSLRFEDGKWYGRLDEFDTSGTTQAFGEDPLKKIKDKTYSLTPLSDGGVSGRAQDYDSLDSFGMKLAALDSANCNVAAAGYLLATKGKDAKGWPLNPALGFYNDGDNELKESEKHMWVVRATGEIIDPTPSAPATPPEQFHQSSINWFETIKYGSGAALLGGAALLLYRRRGSFKDAADHVKHKIHERHDKKINQAPTLADAALLGRLRHGLYAPAGSTPDISSIKPESVSAALDQLPAVPYDTARELIGTMTLGEKRRLRRLMSAKAFRAAQLES